MEPIDNQAATEKGKIFPKQGQENTIFTVSVPRIAREIFFSEPKLAHDRVNVFVIQHQQIDPDLQSALDGIIDDSMTVEKANTTLLTRDMLYQKLVEYETEALGIHPALKSKKTYEKLPTYDAIKVDATATTAEILGDADTLRSQGNFPVSFILDFRIQTLARVQDITLRAASSVFGPIVGKDETIRSLKETMIYADVKNEMRRKGTFNQKPSQRLIIIFT